MSSPRKKLKSTVYLIRSSKPDQFEVLEAAIKSDQGIKGLQEETIRKLERAIERGKELEFDLFQLRCGELVSATFKVYAESRGYSWRTLAKIMNREIRAARKTLVDVTKEGECGQFYKHFAKIENGGFSRAELLVLKKMKWTRNNKAHRKLDLSELRELKDQARLCQDISNEQREALKKLLDWEEKKEEAEIEKERE